MVKKLRKLMKTRRAGFTLIETLTTMFIIGLLILLILPNINRVKDFAEQKQAQAMVQTVQTQVDLYQQENGAQPVTLDMLTNGEGRYLTPEQTKRMKDLKIKIVNNVATHD